MSILPLLLSLLAVNTVSCSEAPSRAQLLEMVQKLTGRLEKVEEKGNLTDEVGKLEEAITGAMEKLGDKTEKLGEAMTGAMEKLGDKIGDKLTKVLGEATTEAMKKLGDKTEELGEAMTGAVEKLGDKTEKLGEAMAGEVKSLGDKLVEGLERLGEAKTVNETVWPSSCVGVRENDKTSRVHTLKVNDRYVQVYCDHDTAGGGWTVIQRRQDGSVDFYRNWSEYRKGFGDIKGNFWLGLDNIRLLTTSQQQTLRVDLQDFDNNTAYAEYRFFAIDGPDSFYRLHVDGYTGTAGDSLTHHNGRTFSTHDNDHDTLRSLNCAEYLHGAWWYSATCGYSNLNGPYLTSAKETVKSIIWPHWKNARISLKHVEMKIRPAM